jgi:hypothetical protein
MPWVGPLLALAVGAAAPGEALPDQDLVFFNARLALRDAHPTEALKLWLLRNALVSSGQRGTRDDAFRSTVWAALGELGLCQEGFPRDEPGGAGLWPLALHNWTVSAMSKGRPPDLPSPFGAFEVGRQQRLVSMHDVLSSEELASVAFSRTGCGLADLTRLELGQPLGLDLEDRYAVGVFLRALLVKALATLDRRSLESTALIEARIFDLDLALVQLKSREARKGAAQAERRAAQLGVSKTGARELREKIEAFTPSGAQAELLRRSLVWTPAEWLTVSPQRRLALFAQVRRFVGTPGQHEAVALSMIDALIDRRAGAEIESWLGFLDLKSAPGRRAEIVDGDRGRRLLELEPVTGFKERSAVALQRGVSFLEAGRLHDALSSFAAATAFAQDSREAAVTSALATRWLSYVLASYESSDEVLATLRALVPRQEYNSVIEDLVWRAALRADERSFERVVASARRGGAFDRRAERLRLLAQGRAGLLATQLRDGAGDEPHLTLGFIKELLEHLESEDAGVRRANLPLLRALRQVLEALAGAEGQGASARRAGELLGRVQAMLEGLSELDRSVEGRARALSPGHETFAGSLRLAPADALPWPFVAPAAEAPSAFVPLILRPVEWRDAQGGLVFGWRISE